jgi:hypothetical protein
VLTREGAAAIKSSATYVWSSGAPASVFVRTKPTLSIACYLQIAQVSLPPTLRMLRHQYQSLPPHLVQALPRSTVLQLQLSLRYNIIIITTIKVKSPTTVTKIDAVIDVTVRTINRLIFTSSRATFGARAGAPSVICVAMKIAGSTVVEGVTSRSVGTALSTVPERRRVGWVSTQVSWGVAMESRN